MTMTKDNNTLATLPQVIILPDDILADIYGNEDSNYQDIANDIEADYWIEEEKAGLLDIAEP